jgi:hypothetical protein
MAEAKPVPVVSTWPPLHAGLPSSVQRRPDGTIASVGARLNFMQPSVPRSLVRNGKVWTSRDAGGSDAKLHGVAWDARETTIGNGRGRGLNLAVNGFELLADPIDEHVDYLAEEQVTSRYYAHCEELVKRHTGAKIVKAFDHNVRSAAGKTEGRRLTGGNLVQGPASLVHGDYTVTSAPARVADLARPPKLNDPLRAQLGETPLLPAAEVERATSGGGRFALINVWRPITAAPVASKPLACCDAASARADELVVFEIHCAPRDSKPAPLPPAAPFTALAAPQTPTGSARTTSRRAATSTAGCTSQAWCAMRRC